MTQPKNKRSGLGRGLASLIPTGPSDGEQSSLGRMGDAAADVVIGGPVNVSGAVYREIDPAAIDPNPKQPRQVFDEEALAELVHSIKEFGLMQPIVVRAVPGESTQRYQLVMGSGGGGPHSRPGWRPSRRSSVRPATTTCCATRCSRTSIVCS